MTSRKTILVIHDEPMLRKLLGHILCDAGFEVLEADNGEMALDVVRGRRGLLHLVVTDIHMPIMGGLEFAREFRPLRPSVPILFMSGRPEATVFDEYELLPKPFEAEALLDAVHHVLNRRARAHRTPA